MMFPAARWFSRMVAFLLPVVLLLPVPANAHDALIESTPVEGAQVDWHEEAAVSFRFNNEILETAAFIAVLDPAGIEVSTADAVIAGDTVSRAYMPTTAGTYTASYRVTSSDGHPIDGSITFVHEGRPNADSSTSEADDRGEEADSAAGSGGAAGVEDGDGASSSAVMLRVVAALVLAVLLAWAFRTIRHRRGAS
ncbi:copper resistance CopC family protein [Aeromicrobium sp. Sec7.5]|uniref:copper resistance CopC family protein n=1 Tax=Aeromicrobium sp. Sec7.5 TaxID=3121276 RepID=UPI002FE47ABB